jgi:DNA modification methylase
LVDRCVLAFSNEGETVFDPFMGVGSSLISAVRNNRKFIGSEFEPKYVELAFQRLESLARGELRIREPGTPIQVPKGKIAQIPDEWTKSQP